MSEITYQLVNSAGQVIVETTNPDHARPKASDRLAGAHWQGQLPDGRIGYIEIGGTDPAGRLILHVSAPDGSGIMATDYGQPRRRRAARREWRAACNKQ